MVAGAACGPRANHAADLGLALSSANQRSDKLHALLKELLARWTAGEQAALDQLFEEFFDDLRRIARNLLGREQDTPLDTTELVSEIYLKLRDVVPEGFKETGAFFGLFARKVRQFLVDEARARKALKRGGEHTLVLYEDHHARSKPHTIDIVALNDALQRIEEVDPRMAEVASRKIFVQMREREIAVDLGISRSTVQRDWAFARRWLIKELT